MISSAADDMTHILHAGHQLPQATLAGHIQRHRRVPAHGDFTQS